ncbi:MAG: hypothetical protein JWR70_2398 [Modestobacter sp.]|nr:hypothetical protein [Modestobacter sp.]
MRLTAADVACWVVKSSRAPGKLVPGWTPGAVHELIRCVRRSYRLELMGPGQPCLLWISGRDRPGVHALGELTGRVDEPAGGPEVPVRFRLLTDPLPRAELLADPVARAAEVLRMPAGSNPSWLSGDQYAAVLALLDDRRGGRPGQELRGAYMSRATPPRQTRAPARSHRSGRNPSATTAQASDPTMKTPP